MGYKNEIKGKKPRSRALFLPNILDSSSNSLFLLSPKPETPKLSYPNYCYTIGKAIPIYVNNFTNILLEEPPFIIFSHDINSLERVVLKIGGWLVLNLQKSMVYGRSSLSGFLMISTSLLPIYFNMKDRSDNNNSSFKITNNPIGGYLCPSGMDGKN